MKRIYTTIFLSVLSSAIFGQSLSKIGKEHIKDHEKCVLTAYWDSNGYSIGYGHHSSDVKKDMKISKSQANDYFNKDIKTVEESAKRIIKSLPYNYTFSQGFFDGLCDLIYNCGEGGVRSSVFYKRLQNCRVNKGIMNESDYNFTIAAVKTCRISCEGHKTRRYKTYKMMLN